MADQISIFNSGEWHSLQSADYLLNELSDEVLVTQDNTTSMQAPAPIFLDTVAPIPADLHHYGPPDRSIIDAPHINFTVEINSNDTHKKSYLYSHRLNRIYVDMECNFSVRFNWEASAIGSNMWARACVVFADEAQAQKRPECCLQHLRQGSNIGVEDYIALNVLHSSRPMGTAGVQYHGSAEAPDSWLSTLVALCKPGPEPVAHAYKFICKSSCSSGINRRVIAILFTLEDSEGRVYGREMVGARVCSCVRRDMLKDEESEGVKNGKKRMSKNSSSQPKQKKIKIEPSQIGEQPTGGVVPVILPAIGIVGAWVAITGLETMLSITENLVMALPPGDPQAATYHESIADLKRIIQDLKDKPAN